MYRRIWLSVVALLVSFSSTAFAASTPASDGLRVSPAIQQLTLSAGQNSVNIDQTITNVSGIPLVINMHPKDFGSIGETGTVDFYPVNYKPASNPHGLQNSVRLSSTKVTLLPGQSYAEQVTLANALSLAAGGHYGAIIYTPSPVGLNNDNKVHLIASVASLIFVETAGNGTQNLHLNTIVQNKVALELPKLISFVIANTGNTQSTPIGYIQLTGPSGKLEAQSILNHNSLMVLPSSSILMSVNLANVNHFFAMPGFYHLKIVYGHLGTNNLTSVSKTFFYLNIQELVIILIILFVIFKAIKKLSSHKAKAKTQPNLQHRP